MSHLKTYTPSQLITFVNSPYAAWYERAAMERPDIYESLRNPVDEMLEIIRQKGYAHEENVQYELARNFKTKASDTTYEQTLEHIKKGTEFLYQARLQSQHFRGVADFIIKDEDEYFVADSKLKKSVAPYMIFQLCIYSEALSLITGKMPTKMKIVTGDGEHHTLRLSDYYAYFKTIEKEFLDFQETFDINQPPAPEDYSDHGDWSELAKKQLEEKKHLSLIANITRKQIAKLNAAGIYTTEELARINPSKIKGIHPEILQRLKKQNKIQLDSKGLEKPLFEKIQNFSLPASSPMDIFFDMEGFPLYEDGLEYLFGVIYDEGGQRKFVDFWAHNHEEEKKAFEDFIDFCVKRFLADPHMHIYHYAQYEVTAMKKLSTKYGTREMEVDAFLEAGVFIDLYQIVKKSFLIGAPNYSIKSVELLYRGKRSNEVSNAGDSVIAYSHWMESGESKDWRDSPLLKSIRDYNEDDCVSTLELVEWLRPQSEVAPPYVPPAPKESDEDDEEEEDDEIDFVFEEAIESLTDEVSQKAFRTLTEMCSFHQRAKKPFWWRYFDRVHLTREELENDLDALSELNFIKASGLKFTYSFNKEEETRLGEGGECTLIHQDIKVKIESVDYEKGEMILHVPKKKVGEIEKKIALKEHQHIDDERLQQEVLYYISALYKKLKDQKPFKDARWDFLTKAKPRLKNSKAGSLIDESKDFQAECFRVVSEMDSTTLCLQGPPGAGKTYTASHLIKDLVKSGKKVGISSLSHSAINHLLNETFKLIGETDQKTKGVKIKSSSQRGHESYYFHEQIDEEEFYSSMLNDYAVIAGTAWQMLKFETDQLDYLFIDEASQVAAANLIAMAAGAKNIIIMGDQMQLGQPTEGHHPGESGYSILQYYLGDYRTVPKDVGIFLPTTYRMHPEVCRFISDQVYESRLHSEPHCALRKIEAKNKEDIESGIVFAPVEHSNNTQRSPEEAEAILKLTQSLLGRKKTDKKGRVCGEVTMDDIIYMAPYNHQVKYLQEILGPAAHVGSVDKFQGQERAIVIMSMCTSSHEDIGSRGMEFIFSINRLNVALSRAQSLAFIVASPKLTRVRTNSLKKMPLLNFWCSLISYAKTLKK